MKHQNEKRPLARTVLFPLLAAFFASALLFNCVGCPADTSASASAQSGQSSDGDKKDGEGARKIRSAVQ